MMRYISGSARPPDTSLTTSTPASTAASAVAEFMVSTLTGTPSSTNSFSTGITRFCSLPGSSRFAPGLVDSPPTSMKSAPALRSSTACSMARSILLNLPPSLKESGVTLRTPTMTGRRRSGTTGRMRATALPIDHSPLAHSQKRKHSRSLDRVPQVTASGEGDGGAPGLSGASSGDASVRGIQHHQRARRLETGVNRVCDLLGEALLQLGTGRQRLDHPRNLAEADDALRRNVGDMRHPHERQQVVLAHRTKLDVANQHEFAEFTLGEVEIL